MFFKTYVDEMQAKLGLVGLMTAAPGIGPIASNLQSISSLGCIYMCLCLDRPSLLSPLLSNERNLRSHSLPILDIIVLEKLNQLGLLVFNSLAKEQPENSRIGKEAQHVAHY